MDRRTFVKQVFGTAAISGVNLPQRSYDAKTISVQLVEELPGITSVYLTEHEDADYVVVEAFYWTTISGQRVSLHKESTTMLVHGVTVVTEIALPEASIVFLRVKEMNLRTKSEFGDVPKE